MTPEPTPLTDAWLRAACERVVRWADAAPPAALLADVTSDAEVAAMARALLARLGAGDDCPADRDYFATVPVGWVVTLHDPVILAWTRFGEPGLGAGCVEVRQDGRVTVNGSVACRNPTRARLAALLAALGIALPNP